jgi:hypothetical protein
VRVHITAEDIERANRIMQDPFDSDEVRPFIYGEPVTSDDGLFTHRGDYVPCVDCLPDDDGRVGEPHLHMVLEGANGGVRCLALRITGIARDYLSRWGGDALEGLAESGLLFPDDDED